MAVENLTTYTEVDPGGRLSVGSAKVDVTALPQNESAYVYKDFTASYFGTTFKHSFEVRTTSQSGSYFPWAMANGVGDNNQVYGTNKYIYEVRAYNSGASYYLELTEVDNQNFYSDGAVGAYSMSLDTTYYCIIEKTTTGTYGTIILKIYSDSAHTNLLQTQSVTLHSSQSYRYLYFPQGTTNGNAGTSTGYVQNLDLAPVNAYTLITQVTAYVLTGVNVIMTKAFNRALSVGQFTLTGIDVLISKGKTLVTQVGQFTLTGVNVNLTKSLHLITQATAYTLTGIDILIQRGKLLTASVGQFILTGLSIVTSGSGNWLWKHPKKNTSIYTNKTKNISSYTQKTKNTSSYTYKDKS